MEDWLILLFLAGVFLLLGPIGFFLTLAARSRLSSAEAMILDLERRLARSERRLLEDPAAPLAETQFAPAPAEPAASRPPVPPTPPPAHPPIPQAAPGATPWPLTGATPPPLGEAPAAAASAGAPRHSVEEVLGTRWAVWIGGLALGLGGLLLVRYSVEQGWFGPAARITCGLLFGLALSIAGEYLRRTEKAAARENEASPEALVTPSQTAAILTAAGTVTAFGTIYAAYALYGFIGPTLAFLALGATGLACLLASGLHRPWLAGLGLLGALAAPLLVHSSAPNPWPLVIYVSLVTAITYGLARLRIWLWLAIAAASGGWLWGCLIGLGNSTTAFFQAALVLVVLEMILATFVFAIDRLVMVGDGEAKLDRLAFLLPSAFAFLALLVLQAGAAHGQFGTGWIFAAAAVVALSAVTGIRSAPAAALCGTAGLALAAILRIWPSGRFDSFYDPTYTISVWPAPHDATLFTAFAFLGSLGPAALAGLRLLRAQALRPVLALVYAGTLTLPPLAALIIVYLRLTQGHDNLPFAGIAGGLGFGFFIAASIFKQKWEDADAPVFQIGLGATAAAALAALSLGLVFFLDRGMLTVALALAALGTAYVERRLDIPALRWCVAALGLGLLLIGIGLVYQKFVFGRRPAERDIGAPT